MRSFLAKTAATLAVVAFAAAVLSFDLFGNVRVGAEPTDDISGVIADGQSAGQEPSVIPVLTA